VSKSDALICALGSLDELNAALGLVRAGIPGTPEAGLLESIQRDLLRIGAELATGTPQQNSSEAIDLERETKRLNVNLPPLDGFVLPGGNEASARAHWARTVCRRAERDLVQVKEIHPERISSVSLAYLNRLSGWLFALSRSLDN